VIVQQVGAGIDRERRNPEHWLHAGRLDRGGERDHVGAAAWELLRVQIPVALGGLPAVVDASPDQAELARLGRVASTCSTVKSRS
jgi:hypothetical protein